jgi:hypothetical protein
MDIWLAVQNRDEPMISVIGAYSTEERAEEIAQRASSDGWETLHFVLDEVPYWLDEVKDELEEAEPEAVESERLRNQSHADGDPQPEREDAREPG